MARIANNLKIPHHLTFAFSDSTVALCWLSKPPDVWKTFVSNRVKDVTKVIPFHQWAYVKSAENPADDATRGLEVPDFIKNSHWFDGPDFLKYENYRSYHPIPNVNTKYYQLTILATPFKIHLAFLSQQGRYLSGWAIKDVAPLLNSEIEESFNVIIRFVREISFSNEIDRLKNKRPLKNRSSLLTLEPFLDKDGILRVGGRLSNSSLADQTKHPIILQSNCHFAKLYCRHIHEKYFHARRKFIATFVSYRFWFVGGVTNLIKFIIRSCVTCNTLKGVTAEQLMGDLPSHRITIAPPFTYVGVDFAGPFQCKCTEHRSTKYNQIYAAVFVCLTVRAVHIEIVSGLSTEKFIFALQTFVARRGLPSVMFSDNATNFVGTKNVFELNKNQVTEYATSENIQWRFIPPASPHHGGIWEAAVKSFKQHLISITRGNILNIEEYRTLFTRIEGVMNSRPLCYKNSIEQGTEIITPSHFLIGRSTFSIPAIDTEVVTLSRRLQLMQNIFKGFWLVWSKDYLNQLQQKSKWKQKNPNVKIGQVVLIKIPNSKPFRWPKGIIRNVYPDKKGVVRVVDVEFKGEIRQRSINNIVILPIDSINDD
ncbi:uncharacterized protein LOC135837249 [Planococcus citri]|uniref:uncharacterized protein LOC135837249 n=1 Tax=Planococcus citri TaxID=170843 RepID=UPI0031F82359